MPTNNPPETYQEARELIQGYPGDLPDRIFKKRAWARTIGLHVITLVFVIAGPAVLARTTAVIPYFIPAALLICVPSLAPLCGAYRTCRCIQDGRYFEDKTKEKILEIGIDYYWELQGYRRRYGFGYVHPDRTP